MSALYLGASRVFYRRCNNMIPQIFLKKIPIQLARVESFHLGNVEFKRRKTKEEKKAPQLVEFSPKKKDQNEVIDVWRNITVRELSKVAGLSVDHVQEVMLYVKGVTDFEPQTRIEDPKILKDIVKKCGFRMRIVAPPSLVVEELEDRDIKPRPPASEENLRLRPPVVTVMGHVDHGKTTLLDTLRGTSVAAGEAGGITQHIGAFTVNLENGEEVTFLDTPGHAAFSAMRARGATVTDIIVLVVAADDGVMEQTKEVIKLALGAKVPIIVAINKIDKPEADIERTKRELLQMGIALEGHGGDTQYLGISALKGTNLDQLVEAIATQATLMGLKSEYAGMVEGVVVESKTDPRRGKLSTSIVTRGTLRKGSIIVSGCSFAKVRSLFDHNGQTMEEVTPGKPVEILGWRELPQAGDVILEVESERIANSVIQWRENEERKEKALGELDAIKLKQMEHDEEYRKQREERRKQGRFRKLKQIHREKESGPVDPTPRVNVIIKSDVHGSLEAILDVLETYSSNDKCKLDIVHYGVGDVNEGDIELAKTFDAIIYAFSVNLPKNSAATKTVDIKQVNIIYRLVDSLKEEINKKLPQIPEEENLGEANVLQLFKVTENKKEVTVLGCKCTKGVIKKKAKYRLIRNLEVIYDGELSSMRHLKNEVDSIKKDVECGLKLKDQEIKVAPGDTLVCYNTIMKPQITDWDPGF